MKSKHILILASFVLLLTAEVATLFAVDAWGMPRNATARFYSAAACYQPGREYRVDLDQMRQFAEMSYKQCASFRFADSENAIPFKLSETGLMYVVLVAKTLFPWLGDVWALRLLHLTLHVAICATVYFLLRGTWKRFAFLVLYGLNPLIVFITYDPFYYFWPVLVSFSVLALVLTGARGKESHAGMPYVLAALNVVNCVVLLIRATTIPLVPLFWALSWWYGYRRTTLVSIGVTAAILLALHHPGARNPWHTAAIGVGVYPNPYGHVPGDKQGHEIYRLATGNTFDNSCVKGYVGSAFDEGVRQEYRTVTRDFFFKFVSDHPLLFVRNAVLNTLQGYAIGYTSRLPFWMSWVLACAGIANIAALLWSRQYVLVVAILASFVLFVPYYPPIASYMFGTYILLVVGWLNTIDYYLQQRSLRVDAGD